jgi:asparagine synthase (glutamine-hydrolysing)
VCGISGIISTKPDSRISNYVQSMNSLVEHRGPDDDGVAFFVRSGALAPREDIDRGAPLVAGLGHRRLSIIDLSPAGHQPMSDQSGRYWIVYNGEVYNYLEIREELKGLGRTFVSDSDSEVVLGSYIQWGTECLNRFNGMWAFLIYDCKTRQVFFARDRFGVKPFYYAVRPGVFAFSSEVKQLLSLPWVPKTINQPRLADFFLWGLETHTDESFVSGIDSLPGSHYCVMTAEDVERGDVDVVRFWRPAPGGSFSEEEAVKRFRELLFDSVSLRLRSDVPVGVTLSGGLDSSSVVGVAGRLAGGKSGGAIQAFNVEYSKEGYSEQKYARMAADEARASLVVLQPGMDSVAPDWNRFIWHMEQPIDGLSYFSNFQIYRAIRNHGVPVVLSGQGGDEMLLGYDRYRTYNLIFSMRTGNWHQALSEIRGARKRGNMPLRRQLGFGLYFSCPGLRKWRRRKRAKTILKSEFYREYSHENEHLRLSAEHQDRTSLQLSEVFRYQLPHLLQHEDRMSMAHSVETRPPLLDYRILELVLALPSRLLLRDGWSKYILRKSMEGIVPNMVRWRTDKMGYETPTGDLIRRNRDLFVPLLRRHRSDSIVDTAVIEQQIDRTNFDERLLCSAVSYLAWKESFSLA